MPLSIWDLPNLFAAHDLETLELQACDEWKMDKDGFVDVCC